MIQADVTHLLVVEDCEANRQLIRELLDTPTTAAQFHFRLTEAEALTPALQTLHSDDVDLILLDLGLPDSAGIETLELIRSEAPDTPIVVLTGADDEDLALRALRAGAQDYLVKGLENGHSLRRSVRMALERAQFSRELEQKNRRLWERDDRLTTLVNAAQDAIITFDEIGRVLLANSPAEVLFGYSSEEILGELVSQLLPLDLDDIRHHSVRQKDPDSEGGARGTVIECEGHRRDGTPVPLEISLATWQDEGSLRVTAIIRDVSWVRTAESAIESLSRQHELLLGSAGQGILGLDPGGKITFANPAALALTGRSVGELVGRCAHAVLHHTDASGEPLPSSECEVHRCLAEGVGKQLETIFWRADGSSFPVDLQCRPILVDGRIDGGVMTFDDISGRKLLEDQLRQAQKMEVVGRLSGGIAHDFNNELSVILLNAGLAQADLEDGSPVSPENLDEIQAAATRATRITRQLLNFSRRTPLELSVVDLRDTVEQMGSMLQKLLPETIELRTSRALHPCQVNIDQTIVQQAILNLATNARDAMPDGGSLELATTRLVLDGSVPEPSPDAQPGTYFCVSVSDTGHGMPADVLARAMDPFFTTKPSGKGTGLGLSMVYGLTRQLGGFLDIESEVDRGTVIRLCLPAVAEETAPDDGEAAGPRDDASPALVLLVEDEPQLRNVSARVLQRLGYGVLVASSGEEALAVYAEHSDEIDLVLSDLVMPGIGGRELHDELQGRWGDVRFILTTGHSEEDGAIDPRIPLLSKPWTFDDLAEALTRELGRARPTPTMEV